MSRKRPQVALQHVRYDCPRCGLRREARTAGTLCRDCRLVTRDLGELEKWGKAS